MYDKLKDVVKRTELPVSISNLAGERQTCIQKTLYGLDLQKCSTWAELAFLKTLKTNLFVLPWLFVTFKRGSGKCQALLSKVFQNPPPRCPTQRLIGALTLHRNQLLNFPKNGHPRNTFISSPMQRKTSA